METNFKDRLNGEILYAVARMVQRTCRFQVSGMSRIQPFIDQQKAFIGCHWHGLTMMTVNYLIDKVEPSDFGLLMPDDWRGGALYVFANKMGGVPFPTNLEGENPIKTGRQVINLVRWAKSDKSLFITPDGPHGPGYVAKPGIAYIAQKSGVPLIPFGAYARHGYTLNRWDMYTVPYPFSRISIHVGEPIEAPTEDDDLDEFLEMLTDTMHRSQAQAAANYYEQAH